MVGATVGALLGAVVGFGVAAWFFLFTVLTPLSSVKSSSYEPISSAPYVGTLVGDTVGAEVGATVGGFG